MRLLWIAAVCFGFIALTAARCIDGTGTGGDGTLATPVPSATSTPTPPLRTIELRHDGGVLLVEVAETPEQRGQGLSGRESMDADAGMLFVMEMTHTPVFSMRGMLFPLDFIWIDESKRVAEVTPDVPPPDEGDEPLRVSPSVPVRYVLELNAGAAARLGIQIGDVLQFDPD